MSGLPVPNTTFQDGVTRVISEWLNPVNDAMNFACGFVGLNDAGVFQYGGLYNVNDYVVYANQLYKCIAPIAPAVLAPDADTTHWTLLANLTRSGIAQVPNIASLRAAVTASIIASTVFVHGYYTATLTDGPDSGGGFFIYDDTDTTSPDNGGTTIVDASGRRWKRQYSGPVFVEWFGAKGDGVTDDYVFIQAAIDFVCPIFPTSVPCGQVNFSTANYLVGTMLNCTNSRVDGTRKRDGLILQGSGMNGTILYGKTGDGFAVIDTTGSQWLSIRDMQITQAATNPSSVAVFQGVSSVLPQTQNQKFERLLINMGDSTTSNSGYGSIGIWNFGAEENTYDTVWVTANLPFFGTAHNPSTATVLDFTHSYQTLLTVHSLGMTTFSGECFLVGLKFRQPSLITEDVNSFNLGSTYLAGTSTNSGCDTAWRVFGQLAGAKHHATVEGFGVYQEITGQVFNAEMQITFGGIAGTPTRLRLIHGSFGQIINSTYRLLDNATTARPLITADVSTPSEQVSCAVNNTDIYTNADFANCQIPENTLWNPMTGNVRVFCTIFVNQPFLYDIGQSTVKITTYKKPALISGGITSTEFARVLMPTVSGTHNATSANVRIKGLLYISGSGGTNSQSTKYVDISLAIASDYMGTLALSAASGDQTFSSTTASNVPTGNDITVGALNAVASGTSYVSLNIVPTRTGVNDEQVNFYGTVEMMWAAFDGRAPSLTVV